MPNMSLKKNAMPSQDPNVRNKNFLEVALGYTEEQALDEAARCLNCKNHPCVSGCPVQVKIPEFIQKITEKDYEGAYQVIHETSSLPAVCGRVCPQETQCESKCIRGIKGEPVGIGRLERFVADWHNANVQEAPAKPVSNGHKVAIIGSGPSGLTCAGDLAKKGYDVTVFEALHLAGGVLVYGIPEFRLPKAIVQKEVDGLKALGVKVETNMVIGRVVSIDELMSEYGFEAVFIGSGAGLPMFMHIPGENLCGVYSANEFLTRINLMKAYKPDSDTPIMDLKGKKVAGPRGTVLHQLLVAALKKEGMTINDVEFISMDPGPALSALMAGSVDAALLAASAVIKAEENGCKTITTAKDLVNVNLVLTASESFAKNNSKALNLVVKTHRAALEWIRANKDKALEIGAKEHGISIKDAQTLADWSHYYSTVTDTDVKGLALDQDFLIENDMMQKRVDVNTLVLPSARK